MVSGAVLSQDTRSLLAESAISTRSPKFTLAPSFLPRLISEREKLQVKPIHQVDNVKVRSDSLVVQVLVKDPGQGGGEVKVNPGAFVENGKIPFDWWWC